MKRRGALSIVAMLVAACGGGGGSDPGFAPSSGETAVAGVQLVAPPGEPAPTAPGPGAAPAPSATPAPATPPAAAPAPAATPAAAPAPAEAVARGALIAALRASFRWSIVGGLQDTLMTETRADATAPGVLVHASNLRPLADRASRHEATVALDLATGPGALTFGGSGTVAIRRTSPEYAETFGVSGPQASIADTTPLPSTIAEWGVPGTRHLLRLNVSGVDGLPEWFRVCWLMEFPTVVRYSCSRHLKADGRVVGADTIHDLGTSKFQHLSNEEDPAPRRVLDCAATWRPPGETERSSAYSEVFRFRSPDLYRGGSAAPLQMVGPSEDPFDLYERTEQPDGTVRYLYQPRPITWVARHVLVARGGAPEAYDYASNLESTRIACR